MEENKIELHSEEVHDIISRPPSALVRYGITVIAAVVLFVIIGSFIFRYPDVVVGSVTITGATPPNRIVARSDGYRVAVCAEHLIIGTPGSLMRPVTCRRWHGRARTGTGYLIYLPILEI